LDRFVRNAVKRSVEGHGSACESVSAPFVRKTCGANVERYRKKQFIPEKSGECGAFKPLRETQNYPSNASRGAASYYSDKKC
jgi:hypothetical protein